MALEMIQLAACGPQLAASPVRPAQLRPGLFGSD